MARNPKKKALYEVIGKGWSKSSQGKTLERLHPKGSEDESPAGAQGVSGAVSRRLEWPRKPRVFQLNSGRIEFSVPYQLAVAVVLGLVVLLLLCVQVGRKMGSGQTAGVGVAAGGPASAGGVEVVEPGVGVGVIAKSGEGAAESTGKNRIVIQMYQVPAHLQPVKEYFDGMGVQSEIIKKDNWYYLVTRNQYDNPNRAGTNGYSAKQRIIKLGAGYKAPEGYETFAPNFFRDAFGMRFDD